MSEVAEIWALTDGRAGNVAQALGLAEAIERLRPARVVQKPIELTRFAQLVPPSMAVRIGAKRDGWPFSGLAQGREGLTWPWPDLVIGVGRRSAPIVAALRDLHGVTSVQMLNPHCAPTLFDAVIVPEHDKLSGGNVLTTLGAVNRITPDGIQNALTDWQGEFPENPHIAVLIGGPSRSATFSDGDAKKLLLALEALQTEQSLVVTTSRRTPPDLVQKVQKVIDGHGMVWTGEGPNPYPAMLANAKAVLVTEDSVNMVSEAATAGVPVNVFSLSKINPKFAQFHQALSARGASRRFTGTIGTWAYERIAEADRIAGDLIRRGLI